MTATTRSPNMKHLHKTRPDGAVFRMPSFCMKSFHMQSFRAPVRLAPVLAILCILSVLCVPCVPFPAGDVLAADARTGQKATGAPRPLRVICWEAGPYNEHVLLLQGMMQELVRLGLAKDVPLPMTYDNAIERHWQWLAQNAALPAEKGARGRVDAQPLLSFLADGFYSSGWDRQRREDIKRAIRRRVEQVGDVDMIFVLDTNTLIDALKLDLDIPILAASITNFEDGHPYYNQARKKRDKVLVVRERDRIPHLVALGQELFSFRKLGVVYDSSSLGFGTALRQLSKDMGFELVECRTNLWGESERKVRENLLRCHRDLVKKGIDAMYVTSSPLQENRWDMSGIFEPLLAARIPTLSHTGYDDVVEGALLGPGRKTQKVLGARIADIIVRIALGENPKNIDTVFTPPPYLAMNLTTAIHIGWDPPLKIISLVEEYVNSDGDWVETSTSP